MTQDDRPRRLVGYVRVSTDKQAEQGISLDAQRTRLREYAAREGIELIDIIEDALSGKNDDRPGLQRALGMLTEGNASGLVVVKIDRLTRHAGDFATMLEKYFAKRYSLVSLSEHIDTHSATGRLMLGMIILVSQWEREVIGERTVDALTELARQGVKLGARSMAARGAIQQIRRVKELHAVGKTHQQIADILNEEGVPTATGTGKWWPKTVRTALATDLGSDEADLTHPD